MRTENNLKIQPHNIIHEIASCCIKNELKAGSKRKYFFKSASPNYDGVNFVYEFFASMDSLGVCELNQPIDITIFPGDKTVNACADIN